MKTPAFGDCLLPGLPEGQIRACYERAGGNEIESGKFSSDESSAALAANAFGLFLQTPSILPPLPGTEKLGWPASEVDLERELRFPWSGGRHPFLDVLIALSDALIGVESKRYEPFRTKPAPSLSDAYDRDVWGPQMTRYQRVRDDLRSGAIAFEHLDVAQLVKHALGLRTAVQPSGRYAGKQPVLFYLFAAPRKWASGSVIAESKHARHREEVQLFADAVMDDEVTFRAASYSELLESWNRSEQATIKAHAQAVRLRFSPG